MKRHSGLCEMSGGHVVLTFSTPSNRCTVISHFPKKRTLYVPCSGFEGRYVTVLLPGASRVLSLCEVEVYPVHFGTALTGSLISLTEEKAVLCNLVSETVG